MNKSLKYVRDRIINTPESVSDMPTEGWDNALIINPMEQLLVHFPDLEKFINNNEFCASIDSDQGRFNLSIEYNEDVDFDYFTSDRSTHDGTMMFTSQLIKDLLYRLFQLGSSPKDKVPKDVFENPANYNYKYIIGDIILHRDFGLKDINGHMWHGETDIVVMPIKFEFSLK